ncbi:hypothetical protein EMIHUDRAFT_457464 [Emiliania huxleyi CCMP1516]|uniref:F-box domain-containing protein n=2 Tax=Emiliania huxleyi TaxID=2903 RepID=A0A0D3JR75_EMIH1|nr:hypothetical protein EMIHUDRAFT_457464 [Emiliania huxleyi CCMP1516]EOD26010.1 hypothetical protein EMIHUDRAFT_457464 [Emiliania huxleyi CCMP1516]|eukprot:XP_005778439.1 hypothetical protein EMIHUDRAFT_457464 [Emiliania huxleyi CCMP1516]
MSADSPGIVAVSDLLGAILSHLDLSDLPRAALVCHAWAGAVRNDGIVWCAQFQKWTCGAAPAPAEARSAFRRCKLALCARICRPPCSSAVAAAPRAGASAIALGGGIVLVVGGATTSFNFRGDVDVWRYVARPAERPALELVCSRVVPEGAFLPARWLASGAAVRGDAYLYGGSADFATLDCLHRLTVLQRPSSSGAGSPLRLECRRVGCLGVGPEGGLFGHSACAARLGGTVCFAAVNNSSPRDPVSTPAAGADCLLLFGGELGSQRDVDGSATSPAHLHGTFSEPSRNLLGSATSPGHSASGAVPCARFCHSAALEPRGGWLVFGGWVLPRSRFLNDVHRLALPALRWEGVATTGAVPRPRCQAAAAVSADGDRVDDLCDMRLLHLPTGTWLPHDANGHIWRPQRGGTNAAVWALPAVSDDGVEGGGGRGSLLLFGGMNSAPGAHTPDFVAVASLVEGFA